MCPESIYDIFATQTNLYALQLQVQRREVDKNWKETAPTEIRRYVGLRIFMSVVHLPDIKMYWSQDRFYGNFAVADVMTRDRFEKISEYLHANDRSGYNREDPDCDKLYLIRPILDTVNKRCLQNYKPHRENAVNEAMVKFRGTLGFRQDMPAKPTKNGIKVWERADSTNGTNGIVEPQLRYCCSVLGACGGTKLQVLQKLQNRAARIVTNSSYDSSASALIQTLNWPTVADMIHVETACMVCKSINDLAPEYLSEIFTKNSACSRKNLRNTATDLQVPLMKTCNGQRVFSYRGAGVWNHLDSKVKQASSFKAFKEGLKK